MEWDRQKWALLATAAGALAGFAAKKAVGAAWVSLSNEDDIPEKLPDPDTRDLIAWSVTSAAVIALASTSVRLLVEEAGRRGDENVLENEG